MGRQVEQIASTQQAEVRDCRRDGRRDGRSESAESDSDSDSDSDVINATSGAPASQHAPSGTIPCTSLHSYLEALDYCNEGGVPASVPIHGLGVRFAKSLASKLRGGIPLAWVDCRT